MESVAYGAHATGLILGICLGLIWKKFKPVPYPFLYDYEIKEWLRIKEVQDRALFIDQALELVKYNPDNKVIIRELIKRIAPIEKDLAGLDLDEEILLRQLMPNHLKDLYRQQDFLEFYKTLERIPHSWSMSTCLRLFSQKDLLKIIDSSIDDERLLTSILVIQAFVERYEKSPKVRNLLRTLGSILDHVPLDSFYRKHLWQIKKLSTSKGLRDAIEKRFLRQAYE